MFVILLMDGEQDAVNAIRVYKRVCTISSSVAIVFALSKVDKNMSLEMQFNDEQKTPYVYFKIRQVYPLNASNRCIKQFLNLSSGRNPR
ncbi:MAG: hypothetical protein FAF03_06880 [Epsilonproteobacteria bacterium]|nr:hypothetical protein [Campylobacterota bacterium]